VDEPLAVAEDLQLDVPGALDEALDVDLTAAERGRSLGLGHRQRLAKLRL
jgi:hypothetical protein